LDLLRPLYVFQLSGTAKTPKVGKKMKEGGKRWELGTRTFPGQGQVMGFKSALVYEEVVD